MRLDSIQAAVLGVKLKRLDEYNAARRAVADAYDVAFAKIPQLTIPKRAANSTHVFHQYTLQVADGKRDGLRQYLTESGVPAMIYYPIPLDEQGAFKGVCKVTGGLTVTKNLCKNVISLPMHTEMEAPDLERIIQAVQSFYA